MTGEHRHRQLGSKRRNAGLLPILIIAVAGILLALIVWVADRWDESGAILPDRPDIVIETPSDLRFPDPVHVQLPDGSIHQIAHLMAPDPDTPEGVQAREVLSSKLTFSRNIHCGFRRLGPDDKGEYVLEPWIYRKPQPVDSPAPSLFETPQPRWTDLTPGLLMTGHFWLAEGSSSPALLRAEKHAITYALGVWAVPNYIPSLLDLEGLDRVAKSNEESPSAKNRSLNRVESAELLLRAKPDKYSQELLTVVRSSSEELLLRIKFAQLLEKEGYNEASDVMLEKALPKADKSSFTKSERMTIKDEYDRFRRRQAGEREGLAIYHYNRAHARKRTGDIKGSVEDLERALELVTPHTPWKSTAEAQLAELRSSQHSPNPR